jgi:hypothetical protein
MGKGDTLAAGGIRATFPSMSHIPQSKWDEIFGEPEPKPCAHETVRNDKPQYKTPNYTCTKCGKDFRRLSAGRRKTQRLTRKA